VPGKPNKKMTAKFLAGPAEKDVACGLHDTQALDHPETLMGIAAFSER
jgi:hypothetical protein